MQHFPIGSKGRDLILRMLSYEDVRVLVEGDLEHFLENRWATIRVRLEVKEVLESYARVRGISLGEAVAEILAVLGGHGTIAPGARAREGAR
ncbi:MAG: hypothetical protein DRJ51_05955 [Thermoprotei archaeon]|nr:MAG: hypothetical protein DRJ51_05955 [Thermoprotei archaeon]RLF02075.1 MAG: hypothetical protein DRJ59_04575 [Thermoprotei archaeon]